jgi:hypothetical protein
MGVKTMGVNLQLLGFTAISRLAKWLGVQINSTKQQELFGINVEEFRSALEETG